MSSSTPAGPSVATVLDASGAERSHLAGARWLGIALALLVACAAWLVVGRSRSDDGTARYETTVVSRGDLLVSVSATGTIEPTNQVDVGSELSGLIEKMLVDENDHVARGQVLAQLDLSKLTDAITRSEAVLASAEAKVLQAKATAQESRAKLDRLRAVAKLSGGKVPSSTEMESAEAAAARASADVRAAEATVAEARATLSSDRTNLAKASIRSPIDGIVLTRKMEPGQTVAASFETPVLFTIAEDLTQMELAVSVDEADVGQVREGQAATFGVDAYPGRSYPATITRVGYGSQTTDGVVSYKTILRVDNGDLSLRPGMTATAEIETERRTGVLLVPNEALRFTPSAPSARTGGRGLVGSLLPGPPPERAPHRSTTGDVSPGARTVWVLRDGEPAAVQIRTGSTDGRQTEVAAGDLVAGDRVVTDAIASAD
ncbi:efflux RND transporter periplasmic adaptor subunit [Candidatus Binatia bacterium]|nr:efflux RND transporter periplasmic adaptor subunit [Candidatus Binatia bacterium]